MQKLIDILCRSLIFLISGALFVALTLPIRAQQITFGTGLVCNQLEDVERYVSELKAELLKRITVGPVII